MRRALSYMASLAVVLAVASPAYAQRTTGSILGTVTDESGGRVPSATVELRGPAIVGTQTTQTSEAGFQRFGALPPGVYSLTVSMTGFGTTNRSQVRVPVGGTVEESVSLKVRQLADEVPVTAEATVVDTTSNQVSTNYDKDWVRNAPIPRFTFFDLINAAPGVNQAAANDSRSTSLGAATSENSYQSYQYQPSSTKAPTKPPVR